MAAVGLEGLWMSYPNGIEAVANVNLRVADREFFAIVGQSGSGKSTLLRLIAGLESVDDGRISIGDRDATRLAPRDRDVAMVFQNPPLLPHLSVFENMAFGLRSRGVPGRQIKTAVEEVSERLGLSGMLKRKPRTLSGGQKQRVALGRAFVRKPSVFLLDEPLSSLDESLREGVRSDLIATHRQLGATMIYVTHDQGEALAMGDRVGVMEQGRLVQTGTPRELYDQPSSRFVASFVGNPAMNLLPIAIEGHDGDLVFQILGTSEPRTGFPLQERFTPLISPFRGRTVTIGLRAEHVRIANSDARKDHSFFWPGIEAEAVRIDYRGYQTLATFRVGPHELRSRVSSGLMDLQNSRCELGFDLAHASWFATDSGRALGQGTP